MAVWQGDFDSPPREVLGRAFWRPARLWRPREFVLAARSCVGRSRVSGQLARIPLTHATFPENLANF
jgi:hypothetical protein